MGQFLRDQLIKNVTIDERCISEINDRLIQRRDAYNAPLMALLQNPQNIQAPLNAQASANAPATQIAPPQPNPRILLTTYIIRFDNKGYRYFDINDVLKDYRQAEVIERLIINLESLESLRSNRTQGNYLELRLDADENHTHLVAAADDRDWCDSAFTSVSEMLEKAKNRNAIIRNAWTPAFVQLLGVITIFILSVWAAARISPYLAVENPFAISLLFVLLICSNIWGYVNQQILRVINYYFPNLQFAREKKDKLRWLLQAVIGGIATAVVLFLLNEVFKLAGKIVGSLMKP